MVIVKKVMSNFAPIAIEKITVVCKTDSLKDCHSSDNLSFFWIKTIAINTKRLTAADSVGVKNPK